MLLNVVKLRTKGFVVFIYLRVGCTFDIVLEQMLKVLVAAASPLRFRGCQALRVIDTGCTG